MCIRKQEILLGEIAGFPVGLVRGKKTTTTKRAVTLRKLLLVILLAGCSFVDFGPPSDLNDACSITRERPKWHIHMRNVERSYGLPVSVQMAVLWQESKFEQRAKTPRTYFLKVIPTGRQSSAYGYAQVIDGTWDWYKQKTGRSGASRSNFRDSVEFIGWYTDITTEKYGISKSDARNQYLAYHEGHTGFGNRSYLKKSWLVNVADKVAGQAKLYERQLRGCRV